MNEILARIAGAAGLDTDVASKAVGLILGFLQKEGPADAVQAMMAKLPGGADLVAQHAGGGGLMGAMPGIMGLGGQLMGAGLSMGQIQAVSKELFAVGRENVGDETMGQIVQAIPGLSQFV